MEGIYEHSLDAKGRLFIPAKIREELGEIFYVTLSSEQCLTAYSLVKWQAMKEKVNALSTLEQKRARPLFAHAAKCELDGQGRILLPMNLRDFAGLKKDVTVVGCGETTEFWDTETWAPKDAAEVTPENIMSMFKELNI